MAQPASNAASPEAAPAIHAGARAFFEGHYPDGRLDRVLLVNPPDADAKLFDFEMARRGALSNFPPYGLSVLAQHLRAVGVDVRILNLNHEVLRACHEASDEAHFDFEGVWQERLDREIGSFHPDLVGVTCMFTMTHESLKRVCARAARSGIPVAIGGVHVTNDVEYVLDDVPWAKVAFLREGDETVKSFVRAARREIEPEALRQLILIDEGERHRMVGELQPTAEQMDVVPAFDLIDVAELSRYGIIGSFHFLKPRTTRFATSLSNRGCRAQCSFCSVRNFNGVGVRQRPVDSVLDELEVLAHEHGIEHVMWLDDDLFKDHARTLALFEGMVKRRIPITWDASNGVIAASCTEEIVAAAAESGCLALILGMESGNARILREIRKPGTVEVFMRAGEVLQKHPTINSSAYLIIGFPGETLAMIKDTVDVSLHMNLDWYRIKVLQPLPNTPIYESMLADGLLPDVDKREVRYITGGYGRSHETDRSEQERQALLDPFGGALPLDEVPTREQLDEIWFHLNYELNYRRVCRETRPVKLEQQKRFLDTICDVIAPGNALALYTQGVLQGKLAGAVEPALRAQLSERPETSSYWRQRFDALGLSLSDLADAG